MNSENSYHVVLGAGGVVGRETVRALVQRGVRTVAVGRRPVDEPGVQQLRADLSQKSDAARALSGAAVAYFTVGLPYASRAWREQWPVILQAVIDASLTQGNRLIYFDNVYAYGRVSGVMTEETRIRPSSKKGQVRAHALRMLERAQEEGLEVVVARSADFFGPGAATSVFNSFGLSPVAAGNSGTWLFDGDQPHSLTYTPDIGQALAILGSAEQAVGRTWHLPTAPALTGREYLELANPQLPAKVMGVTTMRIGALFNSAARETLEMSYQYTAPYAFESRVFSETFGMSATPTKAAIEATLKSMGGGGR